MTENGEDNKPQSWLHRQWNRLRNLPARDVVIGQVGEGATNVIIGKNNVQINVAGRNLTVPIFMIALALIVVVGFLFYPLAEPIWNPWPMKGDFKIAVTEFGVLTNGRIRNSALGDDLSQAVYDQLVEQYNRLRASGAFKENVTLWHDSLGRAVKNVRFGAITGATEVERASAAQTLARRINADVVIYGYLTEDESPQGLVIQFYINSSTLTNEPDAIVGRHRLGAAIASAVPISQEPLLAKTSMRQPLTERTKAIFWIMLGLTYGYTDDHVTALAMFQQAEQTLQNWQPQDGKEVLYYFLGREALFLHRYDLALPAFQQALAINPQYINALAGLAGVYYDKAQLYYLRGRQAPPEWQQCLVETDFSQADATPELAEADIQTAIGYYTQAVNLAPASPWPPIADLAHMGLGLAYQLQGQALIFANDLPAADIALNRARTELQRVQEPYTNAGRYEYLAWALQGLAQVDRLQAHIRFVEKVNASNAKNNPLAATKQAEGVALLEQSLANANACLAQREALLAKPVFLRNIIECGCTPLQQDVQQVLATEGVTP